MYPDSVLGTICKRIGLPIPVGNSARDQSVAAQTLPSYMKDGNEAARWILYNRAGSGWHVMWLIDKSVDGTVGQV